MRWATMSSSVCCMYSAMARKRQRKIDWVQGNYFYCLTCRGIKSGSNGIPCEELTFSMTEWDENGQSLPEKILFYSLLSSHFTVYFWVHYLFKNMRIDGATEVLKHLNSLTPTRRIFCHSISLRLLRGWPLIRHVFTFPGSSLRLQLAYVKRVQVFRI